MIREARLLRSVLYEQLSSFDECNCPELNADTEIPAHLYGLYVLMQTTDEDKAFSASQSSADLIQLLGMLNRSDQEAHRYLVQEFRQATRSENRMRRARVLLAIMTQSGRSSTFLARIAVGDLIRGQESVDEADVYWLRLGVGDLIRGQESVDEADVYWLRFEAAEGLRAMEAISPNASVTIASFLSEFAEKLNAANTTDELNRLAGEYASGKIVRSLVAAIAESQSDSSRAALRRTLEAGEDKLRHFPFLRHELERALGVEWQ